MIRRRENALSSAWRRTQPGAGSDRTGGAGRLEGACPALSIHDGVVPPTINYETPDPECDLDYVPNEARRAEVRYALSNSFGFGGTNSCLLFGAFTG